MAEKQINAAVAAGASALIARSKTRLNRELLEGSGVQFAGTCTAGTDHADEAALRELGIHFASAPGCNANAVSEYVLAALLQAPGFEFSGKTVGIIGCGQVGSRVETKLQALGCRILKNDPPKAAATGDADSYVDLETLLRESDVLTLHVPLVEEGPFPTRNLLGREEIGKIKPGAVLINACRGEVMDGEAVREARQRGALSWLVLDVWDPEPEIPPALLRAADLATPHIAGHSVEGKVNGTRQIREQFVEFFGLDAAPWDPLPLLPAPGCKVLDLGESGDFLSRLRRAVEACYEIRVDDDALRSGEGPLAERFVDQRQHYRDRREFSATRILGLRAEELPVYRTLGFRVQDNLPEL
ncbi:MAG: 4-phosphoerythronate dehydrogenase [Kiritimatiellia bacterium]